MPDETVVERPKNLREKLVAVMSDVKGIGKHGRNKDQNYDYQTAADIFEKVQAAFVKHGVVFCSTEKEVKQLESRQTKGGATMFAWLATMRFEIADAAALDAGCMAGVHSGVGFDTSDKALNKAKTAALKYFLKQTLLIGEDEDDGDRETITPSNGPIRVVPDAPEPITDDFLGDPTPTPTPAKKTPQNEPVAHGDELISVVAQESIVAQCKELGQSQQEILDMYAVADFSQLTQAEYAGVQKVLATKRENRDKAKKTKA